MIMFHGVALSSAAVFLPVALAVMTLGPSAAAFSQGVGMAALVAMALSQLIATRARWVEPLFGPMDRAYVLHKWLGLAALGAILLHDAVDAKIRGAGGTGQWSDIAEGLGVQSLNGLLMLIAITLVTIIPYRIWYWTHRAMGVCFVLGAAHFVLIPKPFSILDPLGLYVLCACIFGTLAYGYTLMPRAWRRGHGYTIAKMRISGGACVLTLAPEGAPLRHRSGQFAFVTLDRGAGSESHPFTLSGAPRPDGTLQISVGALGDDTSRYPHQATVGCKVRVHGPYGRFAPDTGARPHVWIAGGIGITPFLAALENLAQDGPSVDLIYTYRGSAQAPHLDDIRKMSSQNARVTLHLFDTTQGPRLTAHDVTRIAGGRRVRFAYCGPKGLRNQLAIALGAGRLHSETFELRTGVPRLGPVLRNLIQRGQGGPLGAVKNSVSHRYSRLFYLKSQMNALRSFVSGPAK